MEATTNQWYFHATGGTIHNQAVVNDESTGRNVAIAYDKSDAPLLAAAPDLLAACQRILRAIDWSESGDRLDSTKQANILRAAITKATGE